MSSVISTTGAESGMSKVEYETRVSLAACARLMAHYRLTDLTNGLIAARIPDQPDFCLVNRFGDFFEEITATRLQKRSIHYSDAAALAEDMNVAAAPTLSNAVSCATGYIDFAFAHDEAFCEGLVEAIDGNVCLLMGNHGLIAVGKNTSVAGTLSDCMHLCVASDKL
jgi:ribulose-5-phosphate 4-epimerase/fuculose-1-phosphate aldolase